MHLDNDAANSSFVNFGIFLTDPWKLSADRPASRSFQHTTRNFRGQSSGQNTAKGPELYHSLELYSLDLETEDVLQRCS